jgi:lipopolysaccharide export system permease protein
MHTIRRLIHRDVGLSVLLVALAFLMLFSFFDLVEELDDIGTGPADNPYRWIHAALFTLLLVPSRLYELLPIAVLIGSIFVMARLAQSSEFTILRTSGMGPWRALRTLLWMGLAFTLITFAVGDYAAQVKIHRTNEYRFNRGMAQRPATVFKLCSQCGRARA